LQNNVLANIAITLIFYVLHTWGKNANITVHRQGYCKQIKTFQFS